MSDGFEVSIEQNVDREVAIPTRPKPWYKPLAPRVLPSFLIARQNHRWSYRALTRLQTNLDNMQECLNKGDANAKRIQDFNMGFIHNQAQSTRCQIDNLVVVE